MLNFRQTKVFTHYPEVNQLTRRKTNQKPVIELMARNHGHDLFYFLRKLHITLKYGFNCRQ